MKESYSKPFTRADARALHEAHLKLSDTTVPQEDYEDTDPAQRLSSDSYVHEPPTKPPTNANPRKTVNTHASNYSEECNSKNCILHNTRPVTSTPAQANLTTSALEGQSPQANSVDLDNSRNASYDTSAQDNHELTLTSPSMAPQKTGKTPATARQSESTQETLNESWLADESPPASIFNES